MLFIESREAEEAEMSLLTLSVRVVLAFCSTKDLSQIEFPVFGRVE
jgi:hypothetical protein